MNIIGNRPNQVQAYRQLQQASVTLGAAETESKGPIDSYVSDVSMDELRVVIARKERAAVSTDTTAESLTPQLESA